MYLCYSMEIDEKTLKKIGEQFGEQIARLISANAAHTVTINDVNDDFASVSVFDGDTPSQVPLRLLNVGSAVLKVVPTVGSTAVVTNINGTSETMMFLAYLSIDKIEFVRGTCKVSLSIDEKNSNNDAISVEIGKTSMLLTGDTITFNGGNKDGIPVSRSVAARLNNIESDINTLKSLLSSWITIPSDGGASLKVLLGTWYTNSLQKTSIRDIENDKIKQ